MNLNSISFLLGCAGLVVGGVGLAAHTLTDADGAHSARLQPTRAAHWPPHPTAAGIEFHDEMVALLSPKGPPRAPAAAAPPALPAAVAPQNAPPQGGMRVKSIHAVRAAGSRRTQGYEIEFVDAQGNPVVRRYAADAAAATRARPPAAAETYGYSPRRERRERRPRHQYRR